MKGWFPKNECESLVTVLMLLAVPLDDDNNGDEEEEYSYSQDFPGPSLIAD